MKAAEAMTPNLCGLTAAAVILWEGVLLDAPLLPSLLFAYAAYAIVRGLWRPA